MGSTVGEVYLFSDIWEAVGKQPAEVPPGHVAVGQYTGPAASADYRYGAKLLNGEEEEAEYRHCWRLIAGE